MSLLDAVRRRFRYHAWATATLGAAACRTLARRNADPYTPCLDGLNAEALARTVSYQTSMGATHENAVADVLDHVPLHASHHRGQTNAALRAAGHAPPPIDLIAWLRAGEPLARRLAMRLAVLLTVLSAATGCAQTEPARADASPDSAASAARPPTIGPVMVGPMRADPISDAATLVEAMHDRYAETWYRTLTFTQATSRLLPDGSTSVETWREWAALPGRLRIEMDDPLSGIDALYARDSTFIYRDGVLAAARAERNPLLIWGFDVYAQSPAETLAILEDEGLDLGAFRTDVWDGRRMYVLGVPESGEVWVERDRLLFVRLVEPAQGGETQDVRFLDYEPLGGGWIAPLVEVWVGDQRVFWEEYSDIQADLDLDPVLFEPRRWAEGVEANR